MATTATRAPTTALQVFAEFERWRRLDVATFPGPMRRKGPRIDDWPVMPHADAWVLTQEAAQGGPVNLVVRTGVTADGRQCLGAFDLDGKCPCGHDRDVHPNDDECGEILKTEDRCSCAEYRGVRADVALERLLAQLPTVVAVSRTARGFHVICWLERPLPDRPLPEFSADFFGGRDPHALQVPPSVHPTGITYQWLHPPDELMPVVDPVALGIVPDESDIPTLRPVRGGAGRGRAPASAVVQSEFESQMRGLGIHPQGREDEFHSCPWHPERDPSLHVNWRAANFYCFGCEEQGGIRRLRELVGAPLPPTYNPSSDLQGAIGEGLQLGGKAARQERDRLVGGLIELGEVERAERMRLCREATLDATDVDLEAYACPNGDSAPVKACMNSCDDPQCPTCMPWRLGSDWNHHWDKAGCAARSGLTLARLTAAETSVGLDDWQYLKRIRGRFREWRRGRPIGGGLYGTTVKREGDAWRAEILMAVGAASGQFLDDGRAFEVEVLAEGVEAQEFLRALQHAYLNEAVAWRDTAELAAFRSLIRGRRKFQGFGTEFGVAQDAREEVVAEEPMREAPKQPLHRVSGGSGKANKQVPCCPRCGAGLRRLGPFDHSRMEMVVGPDGVTEWRWRAGQRVVNTSHLGASGGRQ